VRRVVQALLKLDSLMYAAEIQNTRQVIFNIKVDELTASLT